MGAVVDVLADETLGCLLDVLGLRRIEPERPGRVVVVGAATRGLPPTGCVTLGLSCIFLSVVVCDSSMLPVPVGEGN